MRAGDLGRAIGLAHRAIDSGHVDPVLFSLRAHWRKENGRHLDALADLERARDLDPHSPEILSGIAECLNVLGHYRKALRSAEDALIRDQGFAAAWFQKALAHQMLNEFNDVLSALLETLRFEPNHVDALARLAELYMNQSKPEAARVYADRALALYPGHDIAHIVHIALDMKEKREDAADMRIQVLLSNPRTQPVTRANALSQLGDLRDKQQRTAEAFRSYREAKEAWIVAYGSQYLRPELEPVPQMLERLATAFAA